MPATDVTVPRDEWRDRARARATSLVPPLRSPRTRSDLVQILKAVLAAVLAWYVAAHLLGLTESFMAPWTAMLTVHATVYRSFTRGGQVVLASLAGIVLAYLAVEFVGQSPAALGVALLVGMLLGRLRPVRDEGSTVATTALFVVTAGHAEQGPVLLDRVICTGVGIALGVIVNFVVLPPLDDRLARREVDALRAQLGELLREMADALRGDGEVDPLAWLRRSRRAEDRIGRARELLRHTREARRGNPRRRSRQLDPVAYETLLLRIDEGIAQARAIARTVQHSPLEPSRWDEDFCEMWTQLLCDLGERVADPEAGLPSLQPRLHSLTQQMSREDLPEVEWPVYGALINSTRSIINILDEVLTRPQG
ncbi:FUSC family protein [Janibacter anophelis]|uniref:FUSC family protein n=1 Tax=Janibacter anophelis TaxID=319054 RepID=UPI0013B06DB4|nr:aromatic acid exporter family protein [Janibacter anophelis]